MRNIIIIFIIHISFSCYAQKQLFVIDNSSTVCATLDKDNTIGLLLNNDIYSKILNGQNETLKLKVPFFNSNLILDLVKFNVFTADLKLYSKTEEGDVLLDLNPTTLSYKIHYEGKVIGVLNFVNNSIIATFKLNNKQYEITEFKTKYILFEISNSINYSNFSCAVESALISNNTQQIPLPNLMPSTPVCVELAIEIDQYTRQTFASNQEATDWALAIIAGVSQIYESQTNAAIQVTYTYVWNSIDPYSAFIAQSGAMLSELKNYWQTNNAGISRDLVHLLTKRSNTGTGGIAYVDVLCDNNWGYGFTSALDPDTTFSFPNPTYTWNLSGISHEIGHNFGSKHTHWCGWLADPSSTPPFSGGVIDNCTNIEIPTGGGVGSCINSPTPQLGTIMSYCNSSLLDFHPIVVSQALDVGIANASCLTTCDYYGCTDPNAFNYNPNVTIDDGSCIPKIYGCIDILATNYDPLANTDDNSCTYCSDVLISISDISCNGYSDGAIDLTITNGNQPFTFAWTGPNGFTAATEDIVNIGSPGLFQVIVEDALQCKDTSDIYIIMPDTLSIINIITTSVSCTGLNDGSVSLNISGGTFPYVEDYGIYNPSQLSVGSYNVSVTDANTCPAVTSNFIISEPNPLQANISKTDISCHNLIDGSLDLTISGGTSPFLYLWSGPNSFSSVTQNISSLAAGQYDVTVTDAHNCTASSSKIIIDPPSLSASLITQDVSCNGGNDGNIMINILGGALPYNYLWGNNDTNQNLLNITANSYSVDVSDGNGCSLPSLFAVVTEPNPSSVTYTTVDVMCFGFSDGSINVTYLPINNLINYTFLWSNGSTTEDLPNLSAGFYTLNIIENNICTIPVSILITQPDDLSVQKNISNVSCKGGANGTANILVSGGTPFYSYVWSSGSNSSNVNNLSSGTYSYSVTDANQCVFNDIILITEPSTNISISDSIVEVSCFNGGDGEAYLTIQGGGSPYQVNWLNSSPLALSSGIHLFEVLDDYGCLILDSVSVSQPTEIFVNETVIDAKCYHESSGSVSLISTGGTPPYTANWFGINNSNLYAGNYIYNVVDSNGCLKSAVVSVQEPSDILVSSVVNPATCVDSDNGTVSLNIVGGFAPYSVNWLGVNPQSLSVGSYIFLVVDSNNCIDSNQVLVYSTSDITVQETINNVSCYGRCDGEISWLISNGTAPYSVVLNDFNNNTATSDSLCDGQYIYIITDNLSCEYIDTFTVVAPDLLQLTINVSGNILEANVTGGVMPYQYSWYESSLYIGNTQQIIITHDGEYTCIVYDSNYCFSDSVTINTLPLAAEQFAIEYLLIYPNPTDGKLFINTTDIPNYVLMSDLLGKQVVVKMSTSNTKTIIDCSDLAKGMYLITIDIRGRLYSQKIVVE